MNRGMGLMVLAALLQAGCYRHVVRSGLPPGKPAPGYEYAWHSEYLLSAIDGHGEFHLEQLCPHGFSELRTQGDFLTAATSLLSLGIYTPNRVTILCAAPRAGTPVPPPVNGYAPKPPSDFSYPPKTEPYPPPASPPRLR